MKEVEQELLDLLGVRLFAIYQSVDNGNEILASIKGGILMTTFLCRFVCHSAPRHWLVTWLSAKNRWSLATSKTVRN